VPDRYLRYIKDQMVGAVVDAYHSRQPARITVGSVDAPSTWGCCTINAPEEDVTDSVINILQARSLASSEQVIATFVEAPYHPTAYGSARTIDPDWPGHLAAKLEATYGGAGIGWEGDIGRQYGAFGADDITNAIFAAAQSALESGRKLTDTTVDGRVTFFTEPVTNAAYMYFLSAANAATPATCAPPPVFGISLCTPVGRTTTPPYGGVAVIGSEATVLRVGDVLFAGAPGEAYPNIKKSLVENVTASQHFFLGLAQDQLGYLIAPASSWAAVVPQGGDNGLFNASPTIGDHVECTQLAAARAVGLRVTTETPECVALTTTDGVKPAP
jgi:hypothetical protein